MSAELKCDCCGYVAMSVVLKLNATHGEVVIGLDRGGKLCDDCGMALCIDCHSCHRYDDECSGVKKDGNTAQMLAEAGLKAMARLGLVAPGIS